MIVGHYLAPLVRIIGGISGLTMTPEWSRDQLPLVQVCPPPAAIVALTADLSDLLAQRVA